MTEIPVGQKSIKTEMVLLRIHPVKLRAKLQKNPGSQHQILIRGKIYLTNFGGRRGQQYRINMAGYNRTPSRHLRNLQRADTKMMANDCVSSRPDSDPGPPQ